MRQIILLLALLACSCKEAYQVTNLYGFTSLEPPSNLYQAGAVVVIEWVEREGVPTVGGLKIVCGPRASLGPGWMPIESETLTSSQQLNSKSTFKLQGEAMDRIKSKTSFQNVRDVTITLENARIVEVQDVDVYQNVERRSDPCRQAIYARVNAGFDVTMVSSNIIADVTYNVRWATNFSVDKTVRLDQMHELASEFGGGHTYLDEQKIHAKNLAVGIKTDTYLLGISLPDPCSALLHGDEHRGLDVQAAMANSQPDAPVVKASGPEVQRIRGKLNRPTNGR